MKRRATLLLLVVLLLLTSRALAMTSHNYRLDWFTPLTSASGGLTSSTHYAVNVTVGQSATGGSASTNYAGCLGYWCRAAENRVYLPLVLRTYS